MMRFKKTLFAVVAILAVISPVYAKEGWVKEKNKKYYYENNEKVKGFKNIDNKKYFFSRMDSALKTGWQSSTEGTWYQNSLGEVQTGKQTIKGKKYYFNEQGIMQKGFIEENGKIYFYSRVTGELKKGWQSSTEGTWYQNKTGQVLTGKQTIKKNRYFFNEQGIMQKGFIEEDGKIYFYSRMNGALKTGWQRASEGTWYQNGEGQVLTGKQTIDGTKYYFNEKGMVNKGFVEENGKLYFYSRMNGALKTGWQRASEGTWYQNNDGEVLKGQQTIKGKKYYFNDQGIMQTGFQTIDGKTYFYSRTTGELKTGVQASQEGTWYQNQNGEVIEGEGLTEVDGKEYYFEGRNLKNNFIEIGGVTYYFDEDTYEKRYGTVSKTYYDYILDSNTGEYRKKQYKPVYYMQKDGRWGNIKYGLSTMDKTGCSPTSMAMAYTSILKRQVLPTEVAEYLYNETDQFNKRLKGTSGMGIIYASDHFGVKWQGLATKEEFIEALNQGKIVYASMQNGKYAAPTYNHAIIMYNYDASSNKTYTLDPLKTANNGWNDLNQIWNEQCMDPDDRLGGYAFYSLEEK